MVRSKLLFAPVVTLLTAGAVLVSAAPASALTKVRSDIPLVAPMVMEGFCPFPVSVQDLSGRLKQTLTFNDDGELLRIDVRGQFTTQFAANGETLTFHSAGALIVVPQPDGTDLVTLNGRSWNSDQGLRTVESFMATAVGHVVILSVFNPDTGFNDFLFIETNGISTDICAALAA